MCFMGDVNGHFDLKVVDSFLWSFLIIKNIGNDSKGRQGLTFRGRKC